MSGKIEWLSWPTATNSHAHRTGDPRFLCSKVVPKSARSASPRRGCSTCLSRALAHQGGRAEQ